MEIATFLLAALPAQDVPPIQIAFPVTPTGQQVLQWRAQAALCGGEAISARVPLESQPLLVSAAVQPQSPLTLRFRIDSDGKPLSIRSEKSAIAFLSSDVAPALAASIFAVDGPHAECVIRYSPVLTSIEDVDRNTLSSYAMMPGTPPLPRAAWHRTQPAVSDCAGRPSPRVLLRAYPDFLGFPGTRGKRDWAMMQFDLDARGRPINVQVSEHSGNASLNAASVSAVRDSRFTPGARTGCTYRYWREAETIEPPPSPSVAMLRPADANCPTDLEWTRPLSLIFPQAFLQRRIEGWAIIAYDVAPWGDVGNLRVLASEPAEGFGTQALSILRNGKKPANRTGYTGCVEKVVFAISPNDFGSAEGHMVAR